MSSTNDDEDDKKLFKKSLKFLVKNHSGGTRKVFLLLSLEWQIQTSAVQKKELVLSLADENDPFFLYVLRLDNEEFSRLKQHQGLLVNFSAFPQSLIDLLQLCIQEENNSSPKYALNLTVDSSQGSVPNYARLELVEVNKFKIITHLSLKLSVPSEMQLRQYLVKCFKKVKEEKDALTKHQGLMQQDFEQRMQHYRNSLRSKVEELDSLRTQMRTELDKKDRKYREEMQAERRKLETERLQEREKLEKEWGEKDCNFRRKVKDLESRLSSAESSSKELKEKVSKLEKSKSDLQARLKTSEKELKDLKKHRDIIEQQNKGLREELSKAEAKLAEFGSECNNLQQDNFSREETIAKLNMDLDITRQDKQRLQEDLLHMEAMLMANKREQESLTHDIAKANDIIRKMQEEARVHNQKLKQRSNLAMKLDQLVQQKSEQEVRLQKEMATLRSSVTEYEKEVMKLSRMNEELKKELAEYQRRLAEKENVWQCKKCLLKMKRTKSIKCLNYQISNLVAQDAGSVTDANGAVDDCRESSQGQNSKQDQALDARYLQKTHDPAVDDTDAEDMAQETPDANEGNEVSTVQPLGCTNTTKDKKGAKSSRGRPSVRTAGQTAASASKPQPQRKPGGPNARKSQIVKR